MSFASVLSLKSSYNGRRESVFSTALLLQSQTMLEKTDFVSTGNLIHIEGDIIVVEIAQHPYFHLGDAIHFTIYSPVGILAFHSTVIAKSENAVMLINPPEIQRNFEDKRLHPRVNVELDGIIHAIDGKKEDAGDEGEPRVSCLIRNLSAGGLGFLMFEEGKLKADSVVDIEMDLGFPLLIKAEVVRMKHTPMGLYCGAQFANISNQHLNSLRAFILKMQVSAISKQIKKAQTQ